MRKGTQAFISVLSLGVIAAGYQAGQAVEINNFASAVAPSGAASSATTPSAAASATESAAPVVDTAPAASPANTANTVAPSPKTTTVAPAPKVTTPAAPAAPASAGTTKDGSAVPYRFGTVQVSVTKSGGKITSVNLLQAGATGGREAAFSTLVDLAIQANGTSFGNLGGATYTVDAFKQSMEAALAKF